MPITTDCRLADKQCSGYFLNFLPLTLSTSHAWKPGRQGYIILTLLRSTWGMERLIDLAKVIKQAIKRPKNRIQTSRNVSSLVWEMLNEVCSSNSALFFSIISSPRSNFAFWILPNYVFHIMVYTENGINFMNHEHKWMVMSMVPGDQLQAPTIPSPVKLSWRVEDSEFLPTEIQWDQTNEKVFNISIKFNFMQSATSLCLEKDMKVWQNLKTWDFMYARVSSRPGIHSYRRPGVWKRELETRVTSQIREDELQDCENGSGTESRHLI